MEILELIKQLAGAGEDKIDEIVALLKKHAKPIFQKVFDEGHGVAEAQNTPKLTKLEGQLAEANTKKAEAEKALKDYKAANPNNWADREQEYQQQITEKDQQITELKSQHANEKKDWTLSQTTEKLRTLLAARLTEGYEDILAERSTTKSQITFDEAGNIRVLQPGKQIPYAGDLDAQLTAFADELVKDVRPAFKRSDVGEGSNNPNSTTGGGGGGNKALFAKIKEEAKKTGNTGAIPNAEQELARRLGRPAPAA